MAKNLLLRVGVKGTKKTVSGLKSVGGAITGIGVKAGIATAGVGALSTKLAGDFQKNLLEVGTLVKGFNDNQLKQMSSELRSVSVSSGLALGSISKAKYDIVSAGFSSAADSAAVLGASAKLAVGGVTSAAEAADLLTTSLNALGLDASDVNKVSDELFTTVRLGKTTMSELAASMGFVLPFAKAMNLDLAGVGAAMATLTASGISTAQATTSLRSAIQSLQSPSASSKKLMEELKIEIKRFDDGTVDLVNTIAQFQGLDPDTLKKLIPRVEGILAIQTMAQNFKTLENNVSEFASSSAGATEKAFDTMAKGFNQQMAMLKNSIQSIMIEIGNVIIEIIQPKIEDVNEEFAKLGEIGFSHLGEAVKNQLPTIMEAFRLTFVVAFNHIEKRAQLAALTIKEHFADALPFIEGDFEKLGEFQELLNIKAEQDTEFLANLYKDMYEKIVTSAETAANDDFDLSQAVIEVKNDGVRKELEIRRQVDNANIKSAEITKKVVTAEEASRKRLQAQKLANATEDMKGAILQGQTAEQAMMSVVRAEAMEAISGLMSSILRFYPFPVNLAIAAGAGKLAMMTMEKGLAEVKSLSFAEGGIVPGVNSGAGDTVPAMLTPGELILNQAQQENLAADNGRITINFNAPVTNEDFVKDFIIPEIDRTINGSLA